MNFFAENIRFLRKKRGLKQSEIAELLDIPRTTWSSYENNASEPNIDGILRIANFFGVSSAVLLSENVSLMEDSRGEENSQKSQPKSTPKSTPNELENVVFEEETPQYKGSETAKNKDDVIAYQREVIATQKSLIESLNLNISMLKEQLESKKKGEN